MRKTLYIQLGANDDWTPTKEQLNLIVDMLNANNNFYSKSERIEFVAYTEKVTNRNDKHEIAGRYYSGEDKRVDNNPTGIDEYEGPDDVSLRYRPLSEREKADMGEVKMLAQKFINKIRSLAPDNKLNINLSSAIHYTQIAAMFAVKDITGPK